MWYFLLFILIIFKGLYTQEALEKAKNFETNRIEVLKNISPPVVCIFEKLQQNGGSGVIFHKEGYLLTNFHVVEATGLKGFGGINDGNLYSLNVLGIDPGGDLAIAKLSGKGAYPFCEFGNSDSVKVGEFVFALGNPFLLSEDFSPTVTYGIVSGIKRYQEGQGRLLVYGNCIQIDSSINPGNSGGPLFTSKGKLIGINGRGSFEERGRVNVGLGYAISLEQVLNFIPDLLATKVCMHGTLNAVFVENKRGAGIICSRLKENSELAKKGMLPGDILLSIDDIPINTVNELVNQVSVYPANWPLSIKYLKDNVEQVVRFRLEKLTYQDRQEQNNTDEPKPPNEDSKKMKIPQNSKRESWGNEGEIRDKQLNHAEAFRLIKEVQEYANPKHKKFNKVTFKCSTYDKEDSLIEKFEYIWLGLNQQELKLIYPNQKIELFEFDISKQQIKSKNENTSGIDFKTIFEKISSLQATINTLLSHEEQFDDLSLVGGDKVNRQRAYVLEYKQLQNILWTLHLSLINEKGQLQTRLLRSSYDFNGNASDYGEQIVEEQLTEGFLLPKKIFLTYGLEEKIMRKIIVESANFE